MFDYRRGKTAQAVLTALNICLPLPPTSPDKALEAPWLGLVSYESLNFKLTSEAYRRRQGVADKASGATL
ncbi:MAG: hypothetical protein KME08_09545 [Aphanothece sp. CMT-3BRIN-NPC111]|nr:hypothetical protein [Aphanothece sp. CMT-3BRIN-NPC111]